MPLVTTVEPDGSAIRDQRERLGLTQKDLGRLAGDRSAKYISEIESGRVRGGGRPRASRVIIGQIARALNAEPELFIIKNAGSEKAA